LGVTFYDLFEFSAVYIILTKFAINILSCMFAFNATCNPYHEKLTF